MDVKSIVRYYQSRILKIFLRIEEANVIAICEETGFVCLPCWLYSCYCHYHVHENTMCIKNTVINRKKHNAFNLENHIIKVRELWREVREKIREIYFQSSFLWWLSAVVCIVFLQTVKNYLCRLSHVLFRIMG